MTGLDFRMIIKLGPKAKEIKFPPRTRCSSFIYHTNI